MIETIYKWPDVVLTNKLSFYNSIIRDILSIGNYIANIALLKDILNTKSYPATFPEYTFKPSFENVQ